jgi:hypothetical protein
MSLGNPLLFVHVSSLTMHAIRGKPLASTVDSIFSCAKFPRSSLCVETLVALCGPGDRTLKVDRVMLDPLMVLKADCLEIQ